MLSSPQRLLLNAVSRIDDLLRDSVGRQHYPDILIPCILLRRLECTLSPTKEAVQTAFDKGTRSANQLSGVAGYSFYNTSPFDFPRLCADPEHLKGNIQAYLQGWSANVQSLLQVLRLDLTLKHLEEGKLLHLLLQQIASLDLHPAKVPAHCISDLYEEVLRQSFGAQSYRGEYFTPPEVARLMGDLLLAPDAPASEGAVSAYDPCCGTGRLLLIFQHAFEETHQGTPILLYGQELEAYSSALCKAELLMRTPGDAERIAGGSIFADDAHRGRPFHYLLCNPPFGKSYRADRDRILAEARSEAGGRFHAGLPNVRDGQLLFLQHLVSHMRSPDQGGSRVALLTNGAALVNGSAGSGESEIRRWVIESDWLEALIALPESIFYNTGIGTYIWLLTNRKERHRQGKIQFIDARDLWSPLRRSVGEKRRELTDAHRAQILSTYRAFDSGAHSRICDNASFGYRQISIEYPLRLTYRANAERIAAASTYTRVTAHAQKQGKSEAELRLFLSRLPGTRYTNEGDFLQAISAVASQTGFPLSAQLGKLLLPLFSEQDGSAAPCSAPDGQPIADPKLHDTEHVPLSESPQAFFEREVLPFAPDAWLNEGSRDPRDGGVGVVGYKLNFARLFYHYQPPRELVEIVAEIREHQAECSRLLANILRNHEILRTRQE